MTGVASDGVLVQKEIFGPVAPIVIWSDVEEELLATFNDTEYCLAAYAYGELFDALHLAERIDAGMVGVNRGLVSDPAAPFGGLKQSGLGREGASRGIEEDLDTKYFSVAW